MTRFSNKDSELWPRIEMVIRWSGMSTNAFARHIGLPREENLYQIKKGNNGLSISVANMICEKFPEIDELWLLTGKKEMLHSADMCRCSETQEGEESSAELVVLRSCTICIAGRILSTLIEKGVEDPIGTAFRYAEDLISKYQKIEKL